MRFLSQPFHSNRSNRLALNLSLVFMLGGFLLVTFVNIAYVAFEDLLPQLHDYHNYVGWVLVLLATVPVYLFSRASIGRQTRVEEDLYQSKEQLRLFIEYAPVALAMFDRDMRYLGASRRWLEDYGLDAAALNGKSQFEVFPELPEYWKTLYRRGMAGEASHAENDRFVCPDGRQQWLRWEIYPWRTMAGEVGGIIQFSEDITERRSIELALQQSEIKYRRLFENIRDGVVIASPPEWRFTSANEAALKLFGMTSAQEFFDLTPWDISPHQQPDSSLSRSKAQQMLANALHDETRVYEWMHKRQDGSTFPAEVLLTGIELEGKRAVLGVVRDITERKRLERELSLQRREMEDLQKRQVASQTAAAFAHEINQPLLAISSYCEAALMMMNVNRPDLGRIRKAIEESERQALRAGQSIRELLGMLNEGVATAEVFDLNREISQLLSAAKTEHEFHFQTVTSFDESLPPVRANRIHIQKAVLNLLHNSIEALQLGRTPNPVLTVRVSQRGEQGLALVSISDNGPGIRPDDRQHLFEPFYTNKVGGIGMGLAISRALIENNGGQLWIDPDTQAGASFHLTLPLTS